jgi:hypothetical protein
VDIDSLDLPDAAGCADQRCPVDASGCIDDAVAAGPCDQEVRLHAHGAVGQPLDDYIGDEATGHVPELPGLLDGPRGDLLAAAAECNVGRADSCAPGENGLPGERARQYLLVRLVRAGRVPVQRDSDCTEVVWEAVLRLSRSLVEAEGQRSADTGS